jgi:tetratricopeptide (TPR) repeat protein
MEIGQIRAAMEHAGFGIRLDLARPDGYLLLGELNLLDGDLLEARRSVRAAAARARGEIRLLANAGLAQAAWAAGDLKDARALYDEVLREDPEDPLNVRLAFAEVLLALGDAERARLEIQKSEDESTDAHVLSALASWKLRLEDEAVLSARRAHLENLYLAEAFLGEPLPEFGLAHGVEEASPDHAAALAARLDPVVRSDPTAARFLVSVARAPTARRESERLVEIARTLQRGESPCESFDV